MTPLAVTLLLTVTVFGVHGIPDDILDNLKKELNSLDEMNTGYRFTNTLVENVIEKILNEARLRKLDQLKCTHLFNAQTHMVLTRDLVASNKLDAVDVSYQKYADLLVQSLIDASDWSAGAADELWLVYVYIAKVQHDSRSGNEKENVAMHEFVFKRLVEYTTKNCDPNNDFNVMSDQCVMYATLDKVSEKENSLTVLVDAIRENIKTLNTIVESYAVVFKTTTNLRWLMPELYMYDVAAHVTIMNNLQVFVVHHLDLTNTIEALKLLLDVSKGVGLGAIRSLGGYQRLFVDTLKLIAVQITCNHIVKIIMMDSFNEDLHNNYNARFGRSLTKFVHFIAIKDDAFFREVTGLLKSEFSSFDAGKGGIIGLVITEFKRLSKSVMCRVVEETKLDSFVSFDNITELVRKTIPIPILLKRFRKSELDDTVFAIDVYVKYLKLTFENSRVFKVAQSFSKMAEKLTID